MLVIVQTGRAALSSFSDLSPGPRGEAAAFDDGGGWAPHTSLIREGNLIGPTLSRAKSAALNSTSHFRGRP
jgi:hypothetical protein